MAADVAEHDGDTVDLLNPSGAVVQSVTYGAVDEGELVTRWRIASRTSHSMELRLSHGSNTTTRHPDPGVASGVRSGVHVFHSRVASFGASAAGLVPVMDLKLRLDDHLLAVST